MIDANFKDHFSAHAGSYARARPHYPEALFRFLSKLCHAHDRAWDAATGNGQAAVSLARHFVEVVATDASATQIDAAQAEPGVDYRVAPAEASGIESASVDLISVAQALHWFDPGRFFDEAARVLKSGGVLAVWCYGKCRIDTSCERPVHDLYDRLDAYWPPERRIVENAYRDVELPFPAIECASFSMSVGWVADEMLDYVRTWSAAQRYLTATGVDPTQAMADELRAAWGAERRVVSWPLTVKAGRAPLSCK